MDRLLTMQRQAGAVLITGLMILLLLTIVGLASMQNTVLQERMAGNFDERNNAFQNAEFALRVAERQHAQGAAGGTVILSDGSEGWPAACPDIDQMGCGGSSASTSTACLDALSWQTVDLGDGVDAEASFTMLPVDNMQCGAAASQGETVDTNSPYGATGASSSMRNNRMILARATGDTGAAVVLLKGIYRPPLLETEDSDDAG